MSIPGAVQLVTRFTPVAVFVLGLSSAVAAQSREIVFEGLTHTPVGRAALEIDKQRNALLVRTFDPAAGDGVMVDLPKVEGWFARMESVSPRASSTTSTTWHAMADSRRISTASLRRSGKGFELSARFTGSTQPSYAVYVYNDGRLVGALGSVPPTAHVYVPESFCRVPEFAAILNCRLTSRFHNLHDGACSWVFAVEAPVPLRLPNGAVVTGNEIRLVEEIGGAGHYPYLSFDGMVIQTNTELTLHAEGVR